MIQIVALISCLCYVLPVLLPMCTFQHHRVLKCLLTNYPDAAWAMLMQLAIRRNKVVAADQDLAKQSLSWGVLGEGVWCTTLKMKVFALTLLRAVLANEVQTAVVKTMS
jgi:hypothetical protein